MKLFTVPLSIAALAVMALCATAPNGLAQSTPAPTPAASPAPGSCACGSTGKCARHRHGILTAEERAKLKAARAAALQDPAVQAAKADKKVSPREFRKALRAAMLTADPSIAPIFEKIRAARKARGAATPAPAN